jgi:hypothetical protein
MSEVYRFNITDEFASYRKYRDFWDRKRNGRFTLYIERDDDGSIDRGLFGTPNSSLRSTAFTYSTDNSSDSDETEKSHESLAFGENERSVILEDLKSVHSFKSGSSSDSGSESGSDSDYDGENSYSVYAEFKNFPTMLIFQERMEGVLDDLLEDGDAVGAGHGSAEWEEKWTAWTFQIIAALCAAQGVLGFTHNDLHTNNIVWAKTDESWLFYKSRDGTVWRVPTYGKIFRIIDFGRAIFRIGDKWFVSDDYEQGGDAGGQYNFGDLYNEKQPLVYPNPSFDLCRYAVSVLEALYPEMPTEKLDGVVLSKEGRWVIHETESPLWNVLWSWLLDDAGKNVLRDEDGSERFPDFDLYQHISEHVTGAKPQEQLKKPVFFKYVSETPGDWEKVYPLFF